MQAAALEPSQIRRQGRQGVEDGEGILGDRGQHVGHRGKGDQPQAHLAVLQDQVLNFLAGTAQSAWGHVVRLHGAGDVQQDEQVVARVEKAHVFVVPPRTGHGDDQQRPQGGPA